MLFDFRDVKCFLLVAVAFSTVSGNATEDSSTLTETEDPPFRMTQSPFSNTYILKWTARSQKQYKAIAVNCNNTKTGQSVNATAPVKGRTIYTNVTGIAEDTIYECKAVFTSGKDNVLFKFPLGMTSLKTKSVGKPASEIEPPTLLNITTSTTFAVINWSLVNRTDIKHDITNFTILCKTKSNISKSFNNPTTSPHLQTNLTDLSSGTTYDCNATAVIDGIISRTKEFQFETKKEIVTFDLTVEVEDTSFTVTWNQIDNDKYEITIEELSANHFVPDDCFSLKNWNETIYDNSYSYRKAKPDYLYRIHVTALNKGTITGSGSKTVSTKPAAAQAVRNVSVGLIETDKNTVVYKLSWLIPCKPNGNLKSYGIDISGTYSENVSSTHSDKFDEPAKPEIKEYSRILKLRPSHKYTIKVAANSNSSTGEWTLQTFTTPSLLPDPPNITVIRQATVISVEWSATSEKGKIIKYTLEITSLGPKYERPDYCPLDNFHKNWTFRNQTTSFTISELNAYTQYNISVQATTAAGNGEKAVKEVVTLMQAPDHVSNFLVTYYNHTKDEIFANISWRLPCLLNGPLNDTQVKLSGSFTEEHDDDNYGNNTGKQVYFTHSLKYSYSYTLEVWLILDNGTKGNEGQYTFTTPVGFPGPVASLNASTKYNSFEIKWEPPTPVNRRGIITNYTAEVKAIAPAYEVPPGCDIKRNVSYDATIVNNTVTSVNFHIPKYYYYYVYEIAVTASTEIGRGEPKVLNITSLANSPESVELLDPIINNEVSDDYTANATIHFKPACYLNGPLKTYILTYKWSHEFKAKENSTSVNITKPSYTINLRPEFNYVYNITTVTKHFFNIGDPETFTAPAGVPKINIPIDRIPIEPLDTTTKLTLKREFFDNENGKVKYIALLLTNGSSSHSEARNYSRNGTWPDRSKSDNMVMKTIIKDPFAYDNPEVNLVIGNESTCSPEAPHCNKPLEVNKDYFLVVRVYTSAFYRNSPTIHFKTAELSHLDLILGILFGVLFVVLAAFVAFYLWRRKCIKIPNLTMLPAVLGNRKPSEQQNVALRTSYPPKRFFSYYRHLENNPDILKQQYMMLKAHSIDFAANLKTHFAKLPENRRKNRYTNISPFDETRVKLMIDEDDEIGSDYINASYIRGYTREVEYIATQGPLESTCRDFWKMILQENVSMIVMVSLFIEQDKLKCHRYFPKNHETMQVGDDIEVKCSVELHFGIYCVRTLQVKKDNFQTFITHMQFLEWPDFGVPTGTEHMLQFCYQMRDRIEQEEGTIVVHCSAGVGRTGTLIATDILIQAANAGKNIDVYGTVAELRKQRMNMVQTEEQYIYIHKLLMEHLERPKTSEYSKILPHLYENVSIINDLKSERTPEEVESRF